MPAHGTAVINPDKTIAYTPAANYDGADIFSYTIADGDSGTATATVNVTVTAANDGPAAVDDTVTLAEDTAATIAVLANDTDLDGDTLTVSSVTVPAHGTAVIKPGQDDRLYAGRELRRRGQLQLHDCGRRQRNGDGDRRRDRDVHQRWPGRGERHGDVGGRHGGNDRDPRQ